MGCHSSSSRVRSGTAQVKCSVVDVEREGFEFCRRRCTVKTVVISLHSTCKRAFQGLGAFVWSLCCSDCHAKPVLFVRQI